ncbi:hypothetical protein ASF71_18765 [Deinococcus sp. Leaf326]|nr:hypothetical protein ASF71_18765 [Deinococcus sp. Leaf326]
MLDHDLPEIGPAELIRRLQDLGHPHDTAQAVVEVVCAAVAQELIAGRNVTLQGIADLWSWPTRDL